MHRSMLVKLNEYMLLEGILENSVSFSICWKFAISDHLSGRSDYRRLRHHLRLHLSVRTFGFWSLSGNGGQSNKFRLET